MRRKRAQADVQLAEIAAEQHGVVTVRQLRAIGFDDGATRRRAGAGRLHRLHRDVYAVGHRAPSHEREWMAAVLACGQGAVLSHRSAAALWELLPPPAGPIDVSTPARSGRGRRAGIRLHRCVSLVPGATTRHRGIPVTTPARTVADLKNTVPDWQCRKAVRQAEFRKLDLGPEIETDGTRSDLEGDFLLLCRRSGLRLPPRQDRLPGRPRPGPRSAAPRSRRPPLQRTAAERAARGGRGGPAGGAG